MFILLKDHPAIGLSFRGRGWALYRDQNKTTPRKAMKDLWGATLHTGITKDDVRIEFDSDEACVQFLLSRPWEDPPWLATA